MLWIGHFDLSASLGVPGDFASSAYRDAVERILAAGEAAGKPVGMVCGSVDEGPQLLERGFRLLAYSFDLWIYQDALRAGIEGLAQARRALRD